MGSGVTPEQAVTVYNPMSPTGATGQARLSRLSPEARTRAQNLKARAHLRREVRVTTRYLEMLMAADPELFKTESECETWIRTKFKDHLLSRLRAIMWPDDEE